MKNFVTALIDAPAYTIESDSGHRAVVTGRGSAAGGGSEIDSLNRFAWAHYWTVVSHGWIKIVGPGDDVFEMAVDECGSREETIIRAGDVYRDRASSRHEQHDDKRHEEATKYWLERAEKASDDCRAMFEQLDNEETAHEVGIDIVHKPGTHFTQQDNYDVVRKDGIVLARGFRKHWAESYVEGLLKKAPA